MIFANIGKSSLCVGVIAQGTTQTGGYSGRNTSDDAKRADAIRYGVDCGMNLIDTAELYGGGHAEEIVGMAIKGIRERVCVASKFNPAHNAYADVIQSAEHSLARLKTDYIDLYQIHWPNPAVPIEETLEALKELIKQGKIRHIGVSNFTLPELMTAELAAEPIDIISNQMEYNIAERTIESALLPYCQQKNISLLAYSPLMHGTPLGSETLMSRLRPLANKYSKTINQIVIRWLLRHKSIIAIIKSADRKHIEENANSLGFTLDVQDDAILNTVFCRNYAEIMPSRVRVGCDNSNNAYRSVNDAILNACDLIPSPSLIAENIGRGNLLKPIPVIRSSDSTGRYDYDLIDYQVLYWGWVIAKGIDAPMPICIRNSYG